MSIKQQLRHRNIDIDVQIHETNHLIIILPGNPVSKLINGLKQHKTSLVCDICNVLDIIYEFIR